MEKGQGPPPLHPAATAYVDYSQYPPTAPPPYLPTATPGAPPPYLPTVTPGAPSPYPPTVTQVQPSSVARATFPVVPPQVVLGSQPVQTVCRNCHQAIVTTTVNLSGACVWLSACVIFLCCWPLFWIPLFIDSCKDVEHICPACGNQLGVYKRL